MARKPSKAPSKTTVKLRNGLTVTRNQSGRFDRAAVSGNGQGLAASMPPDSAIARRRLNAITIQAMSQAFEEGGNGIAAVRKVLKQQPAQFLKLLTLIIPRELEVTQRQGPKAMSDDAIAQAIATIEAMLAKRARPGDDAKLVEGVAEDPSAPST